MENNFLKNIIRALSFLLLTGPIYSQAIIDANVITPITKFNTKAINAEYPSQLAIIVFFDSTKESARFSEDLTQLNLIVKAFSSFPAVLVSLPYDLKTLLAIANHPSTRQISLFRPGHEELEFSEQAILLKPSLFYPDVSNWWANGYTGKNSTIGLIDSGIATEHPALAGKQFIVRKEAGSGYDLYKNGVRTPHGTGVACIYAGAPYKNFPTDVGIAEGASTIITGLAGEGDGNIEDITQTLSTLDWMLNRVNDKPDVINYSFGNGETNCEDCSDWSGLAKIVDYVVNHHHILWIKSAGNKGFIEATATAPFASTMTVPADNYNGLTVANMNPVIGLREKVLLNPDRSKHAIRYTSSRGPTLMGRKKPDISAPGNNTRTCAPDPSIYPVSYTQAMNYRDGYRLMGGTSAAAPHVGAASLLLREAGIGSPMAIKALLINSADAYTDNGKPGPDDPKFFTYDGSHYPVMGSEWNRTYGWGYLNMQKAYEERANLIEDNLTTANPQRIYEVDLPVGAKITLIHERRVGYSNGREWKLSHLSLEVVDKETNQLITRDASPQDTVHQVANCQSNNNEVRCSLSKPIRALVKVKLLNSTIDGSIKEPFALASTIALEPIK